MVVYGNVWCIGDIVHHRPVILLVPPFLLYCGGKLLWCLWCVSMHTKDLPLFDWSASPSESCKTPLTLTHLYMACVNRPHWPTFIIIHSLLHRNKSFQGEFRGLSQVNASGRASRVVHTCKQLYKSSHSEFYVVRCFHASVHVSAIFIIWK